MRFNTWLVAAACVAAMAPAAMAADYKVGAKAEGGTYLFREPVEMYWNDWFGFPIMTASAAATRQSRVIVVGEGKTAGFVGQLSINCGNGKFYWEGATQFGTALPTERAIQDLVPTQVVGNARRFFCAR
jgi:hypothetical protein